MKRTAPKSRPIATRSVSGTKYKLHPNGELWTAGRHGRYCGLVSDPGQLDAAIESHEEEVRCLFAGAMAEFSCYLAAPRVS